MTSAAAGVPADSGTLLEQLATLDSCSISDALDTLGLKGAVVGIGQMWDSPTTMAGRVRTVTAAPRSAAGPATHIASPLVAAAEPGDVVVIDNHGRTDVSCWGGLLAEAAVQHNVAGVIVDGACRDVQESAALGLPLYARAAVPVSARGRIVQQHMDEPIQIAGVHVETGDYVVADRNGVAFIPQANVRQVVDLALRITARELEMAKAVRSGRSVQDVMHDSQFPTITAE
jgi:regulator of RNase E activity RraA